MELKPETSQLFKKIRVTATARFKKNYEQVPRLSEHCQYSYKEEDKKIMAAFLNVMKTHEWQEFKKVTIDGYIEKLSINLFDELTDSGNRDLIHDLSKKL